MKRRFNGILVANGFQTKRSSAAFEAGNTTPKIAVAVFNPSANVGERTIGAHGLGIYVPDKAVIKRAWYNVITTFTSATDAGTVALSAQSANDLKAAIAISNGANPFDAGILEGVPVDTAATRIKLTAERELVATVAVEALTAGKLVLYVEYIEGA